MKKAFTLVEISIVLIIISLIAGGVIAGKELIQISRNNKIISKINEISSAKNVFNDRYFDLPGDMRDENAKRYFGEKLIGASNGNSNGFIESDPFKYNPGLIDSFDNEVKGFFYHLISSELVNFSFDKNKVYGLEYPLSTENGEKIGIIPYTGQDGYHYYFLGFVNIGNENFKIEDSLSPSEAFMLDEKLDDGKPMTGGVKAKKGGQQINDNNNSPNIVLSRNDIRIVNIEYVKTSDKQSMIAKIIDFLFGQSDDDIIEDDQNLSQDIDIDEVENSDVEQDENFACVKANSINDKNAIYNQKISNLACSLKINM